MNQWANTVLTDKGAALLSKLSQGNTLNITKATTGGGYVTPGLLTKQTTVTSPQQELTFRPVSYPEEGQCAITVSLKNEGLAVGYEATQVGLFATDPDEGEVLLFITQATDAGNGTIVPSETEMPGYSAEWTFYFQYGQADEVSVIVDPAGTVSRVEMETYIDEEFVRITNAEIDILVGFPGGGDIEPGGEGGGGGVYTLDHSMLYNRNIADQHTIESITGLKAALTSIEGEDLGTMDIEAAWDATNEA